MKQTTMPALPFKILLEQRQEAVKCCGGGAWGNLSSFARAAYRGHADPLLLANPSVGFRCVQE